MGNYLTALGKKETVEGIMEAIGARPDLPARTVAKALAKKLSSHELTLFLHVARNPKTKQREGLGER